MLKSIIVNLIGFADRDGHGNAKASLISSVPCQADTLNSIVDFILLALLAVASDHEVLFFANAHSMIVVAMFSTRKGLAKSIGQSKALLAQAAVALFVEVTMVRALEWGEALALIEDQT